MPGAGCSIGVGAEEKGCGTVDVAGTTLRVSATDLLPHTPVTVRVGVDVPTPSRATVPWSPRFDPILGRNLTGVMLVGALTLAAVALGVPVVASHLRQGTGIPGSVLAAGGDRPGAE